MWKVDSASQTTHENPIFEEPFHNAMPSNQADDPQLQNVLKLASFEQFEKRNPFLQLMECDRPLRSSPD
jgi:hypothetical protein